MERMKLSVDLGLQEIEINGSGILRFNPSDPNIYARFYQMRDKLIEIEKKYQKLEFLTPENLDEKGFPVQDPDPMAEANVMIHALHEIDAEVKKELAYVFGPQNDFNAILGGVNLMAVAGNGERVITNLLDALGPIMAQGAQRHLEKKADGIVAKAQAGRAQRRAAAQRSKK